MGVLNLGCRALDKDNRLINNSRIAQTLHWDMSGLGVMF